MKNYIFRPTDKFPKRDIKMFRLGLRENLNFRKREMWYPVGWGFNNLTLGKIHSKLHYLAWHAPKPIQQKYKKIYDNFYKKHFGTYHASVRYLNKYSCHEWL